MNRVICGMTGILLVAGLAACNSDPGVDFVAGDPTAIQATPTVMFINDGATEQLLLRLVNKANYSVPAGPYTISNVGAGLTIVRDTAYRPDYLTGTLKQPAKLTQQRYLVSADLPTGSQTSFTVSSGSISQEITVRILPSSLGPALSSTAPAIGDPVTITAPPNVSFSDQSTVDFEEAGGEAVILNQDATSITFVPFPGSMGPATVDKITLNYAATLTPRSLKTTNEIAVADVAPVTVSNLTPAIGQTITVAAGTGETFPASAKVTVESGGDPVETGRTANSITVIPIPGSVGFVTVEGVRLTPGQADTLGTFDISNTDSLMVPAVAEAPATVSNATPATGAATMVTLAGNFKFIDGSGVTIGGDDAVIIAISADSTTATVVPVLGTSGEVAFTGIALGSLLQVPLNVPSDGKSITPSATFGGVTLTGGTDLSNAPVITLPTAVGLGVAVTDMGAGYGNYATCGAVLGADSCRLYKIVVSSKQSFHVSLSQNSNADLGLYLLDASGAYAGHNADGLGQSATPETGSFDDLDAGTYYLAVAYFGDTYYPVGSGPLPTVIQVALSRTE